MSNGETTDQGQQQDGSTTATEAAPAEVPARKIVFDDLKECVATLGPGSDDRVYRVKRKQGAVTKTVFVTCKSPTAAAMAVVGEENVELVPPKERYDAALEALAEARRQTT